MHKRHEYIRDADTYYCQMSDVVECVAVLALKKNSTHLHSNQPKLSPVSESSTHLLTKLCMLFPAHLQARELSPQTYSLSLPLEWSQVTHIPASIKSGGAYKPEKSAFYSTLPDNCVMIPVFQDGSLPFQYKGPQATSKGHTPLLIPVAAMGKCKQANEFQSRHYGHLTSLIIHGRIG